MSIRYNGSNKVISGKKYIRFNGHTKYKEAEVHTDYLCFTANQSNASVGYSASSSIDKSGIQYSYDGNNWVSWNGTAIALSNVGDKIYVKNNNNSLNISSGKYLRFTLNGSISATGNIMSMINYKNLTSYCFCRLFYGCTSLTTAPALPATTLADNCYNGMFWYCTSLTTAPALPATTLQTSCYNSMFYNCTSLTTAPALPATTLQTGCYNSMFYNCTSLTTAPALPATTLQTSCYSNMFSGCSSLKISNISGNLFFSSPSSIPYFAVKDMFLNTGGTYTNDPVANGNYYYY